MILNYMKTETLDMLKADITNNLPNYQNETKWIDTYFANRMYSKYYFNSNINVPDFELIKGGPKYDYQNSVIIYEAMNQALAPIQATDLRLWAYLAHDVFWDYMNDRWSIAIPDIENEEEDSNETNKLVRRVISRYFFEGIRGVVKQGISRLYWSAHLTYDDKNSNPYEFTEYILAKQDIYNVASTRSLARNKNVLLGSLKTFKNAGDLSRTTIRNFYTKLNQAGGIIVLDSLSREDAEELSKRILDEVMNSNNITSEVKSDSQEVELEIASTDEKATNQTDSIVRQVGFNSKIHVENVRSKQKMPIVIAKNNLQTKPSLIGLKEGDQFHIGKEIWKIVNIL